MPGNAGYNIYHGCGRSADSIDYQTPVANCPAGCDQMEISNLAADAIHWFAVRSVNQLGIETPTAEAELRLELDAAGELVPPRPAPVAALDGRPGGAGSVILNWPADSSSGEVAAERFRIYSSPGDPGGAPGGGGPIDFSTPIGEVAAEIDRQDYQWQGGQWPHGTSVALAVRAETLAGGIDDNPPSVELRVLSAAPLPVGGLAAEPVIGE